VIRASATGAALASITPPRPYGTFTHVSGAADDRTFVVAVQRWVPIPAGSKAAAARQLDKSAKAKFFLLRFNPAGRTARLTALPVPMEPGGEPGEGLTGLAGIALSPDGSRLAIAVDRPAPLPPEITVASVATGSERTWAWPGKGWTGDFMQSFQPLSRTADGRTLAFQQGYGNTTAGVRLLDTRSPGGNLLSSSKPAAHWHFDKFLGPHADRRCPGHQPVRAPEAPVTAVAVGVLTGDQFTPLPKAFAHYTGEIAW
jgi:hypothetical protein